MKMHPDDGLKGLEGIYKKYASRAVSFNEAETRAKIIDAILKECLGWEEDDIRREDRVHTGFTDYKLMLNNSCRLIIEAKRAGEYFDIPRTKQRRTYKIGASLKTVANLMEAMGQVRSYCTDIGCKYGAVFNGYQLVVFCAITIGKAWTDGYCIVFSSLDDIKDNFNIFWNILARESIDHGSLIQHLDIGKSQLTFKKIIQEIHNPEQSWARNELYTYVQPIADFVFSELIDEARTEVLKKCYVYDRSNKELGDELEDYFIDKLPHFAERYKIKDIFERQHKAGVFQKEYLIKIADKAKGSIVVLVGGIGCGKSTFLHRFFKHVLNDRENLIWFYTDFRNVTLKEDLLEDFICHEIEQQWTSKYAEKLQLTLDEFGFAVSKDDLKHYFAKLFNLLRKLGFSVTLVIDNVDQHDVQFQEKIFLVSSHLTAEFKTVTIIALREETFLTSTQTGVFDAYYIPKFHLASPDFTNLILARVDFTIGMLGRGVLKYDTDVCANLTKYFTIIKSSLKNLNVQSQKLVNLIESISVGNMRDALRMFNYFIVSGNTNVEEMFQKYDRQGHYQIAYHQFIKSIMLGEHRYYSQERSHLMNLFDFDTSLTDSHYNILRVLEYLLNRNNRKSPIGRGYISIDALISAGEEAAIRREALCDSLLRLSQFSLVEFDNQSKTDLAKASYVKITHAGKYYLMHLVYEFSYLDTVLVDTPVSDDSLFNYLWKYHETYDLNERLGRTERFLEYLRQAEVDEFREHPEYVNSEFANTHYGTKIFDTFPASKKFILTNYQKGQYQKNLFEN